MPFSAELEQLGVLNPIADDQPAGRDLREDSDPQNLFRAVKEAREEARRIERQAEDSGEDAVASVPHWRSVRDDALNALATETKDLQIAAYLIEALLRLDGFAGLRLGFEVSRALVENFWDGLYPSPDEEDGIGARVLPLQRLNGDLLTDAIMRVPITEARGDGPFSCLDKRETEALSSFSEEERTRRIERGAVTHEQVHRAIIETSKEFYRTLLRDLSGCRAEFAALEKALDQAAGVDSPRLAAIREALNGCQEVVDKITKDMFPPEEEPQAANGQATGGAAAGGGIAGGLKTREDAFRMLDRVAEFFEARDPQNLIAYQIRKVIRMGKMSSAEFFAEMLEDEEARRRLFKSVGIDAPAQEE